MNITLIGMAGVGKTLIGRALAKALNCDFIDSDDCISLKEKSSLQEIVNSQGEDRFLEIEEKTILQLELNKQVVIATGGSVVYSAKAMEFLKANSKVIHLEADFGDISRWISNVPNRGLIGIKEKTLKEVFKERQPLYEKYADYVFKLDSQYNINSVIEEMVKLVFN
tara:strand:+ start:931 stop:1431 length:501 start_codon:yes stop_codon:yes gene_type:complete